MRYINPRYLLTYLLIITLLNMRLYDTLYPEFMRTYARWNKVSTTELSINRIKTVYEPRFSSNVSVNEALGL